MKRITGLMALLVAMALGTASAWAATPEVGQGNTAAVTAGNKTVTVGTGTGNAVLGGSAANSQLTVNVPTSATFTYAGTVGGAGANQNNVGCRTSAGATAGASAARKDRRSGARPYLATNGATRSCNIFL